MVGGAGKVSWSPCVWRSVSGGSQSGFVLLGAREFWIFCSASGVAIVAGIRGMATTVPLKDNPPRLLSIHTLKDFLFLIGSGVVTSFAQSRSSSSQNSGCMQVYSIVSIS